MKIKDTKVSCFGAAESKINIEIFKFVLTYSFQSLKLEEERNKSHRIVTSFYLLLILHMFTIWSLISGIEVWQNPDYLHCDKRFIVVLTCCSEVVMLYWMLYSYVSITIIFLLMLVMLSPDNDKYRICLVGT